MKRAGVSEDEKLTRRSGGDTVAVVVSEMAVTLGAWALVTWQTCVSLLSLWA